MFRNDMPRYDILSEDAMAVLERGWRRLLSDIGVEFLHEGSLERFRAAGQRVEGSVVKFDPD
ncbi:MAG TPA: trimethylamine methyltransferase family protein, partial [Gaiellales bacterium]|nr:trimethylamine methyltransferase family protein [Gaiellales bacterium]